MLFHPNKLGGYNLYIFFIFSCVSKKVYRSDFISGGVVETNTKQIILNL